MKDFAKSIRTGNETAEERLGLNPIIEGVTKDIIEIYKKNGKNRELTKKELIERHHLTEKQAEEALRKIVGNSRFVNKSLELSGAEGWYEEYERAKKQGDQKTIERTKAKAKERISGIESRRREIELDLQDLDKALQLYKKIGNSKVGNADPRIQAFKSKIPALEKQGDIGALKDIYSFVDDMIKSLQKRREELARDMTQIDKDIGSYIDLRSELKYKI